MEPLKERHSCTKSSNTNANYALCDHDNPHVPIEAYCPYVHGFAHSTSRINRRRIGSEYYEEHH